MKKLFRRLFPDKSIRAFRKMHRRHRKELINHAKKTGEWDWCWLHDGVIMQVRHMYEYYTAGYNVWQEDERRFKLISQLKEVLDLEEELHKLADDSCGVTYDWSTGKLVATYPDDFKKRLIEKDKRETMLYKKLYTTIGKYILWWWD